MPRLIANIFDSNFKLKGNFRLRSFAVVVTLIAGGLPVVWSTSSVQAVADCTPTAGYAYCKKFWATGGLSETFSLPAYVNAGAKVDMQVWGAGGAGSLRDGNWTGDKGGGAGGYTRATVTVKSAGETFTVIAGSRGRYRTSVDGEFGGGGAGGISTLNGRVGGQGGGFSGVFAGIGTATPVIIAGGGGGGSSGHTSSGVAGGGGAMGAGNSGAGQSGNWSWSGAGGTVTAGGAAATLAWTGQFFLRGIPSCPSPALPGTKFKGGQGCGSSIPNPIDGKDTEGGGGGGGGYFGGGGGREQRHDDEPQNGGGGGGSGFSDLSRMTVLSAVTGGQGVVDPAPGGITGNTLFDAGVGRGGRGSGDARASATAVGWADGGAGMVVIQWSEPPTARPDTTTGNAATPVTTTTGHNDSTPAGSGKTLDFTSVRLCGIGETAPNCTATTRTIVGEGTYSVNTTTGEVTFTSVPGYVGTATQTYVIADSHGLKGTSAVSFNILGPTMQPDSGSGPAGSPITINPLTNDSPSAGRTLTPSSVRLCQSSDIPPNCSRSSLTIPNEGTYSVNLTTGAITFTSVPGFVGTPTLPYSVTDSAGAISSSTITFSTTVPPAARVDAASGGVAMPISLNPLTNDLASSGATLTASSVKLCASNETAPNCTATSRTVSGEGTYVVNPTTGVVTFTGVAGFVGTSIVPYVVTDSSGQKANSTVSFTTVAPPVARPDQTAGAKDTVLTLNPLANDAPSVSASLDPSTVLLCGVSPVETAPSCTQTSVVISGEGTYAVNPTTGVMTFTGIGPSYNYSGTRVLDYVIADSYGQSATSTATFIALPPPAASAVADSISVAYNTTATFTGATGVLANDFAGTIPAAYTTPGTVALDATSVILCGATETQITSGGAATGCTQGVITVPGEGTWTLNSSTQVLTFVPLASFSGVSSPVPYAVCNTVSGTWAPATPGSTCAASTATVTVAPPPTPNATTDSGTGIRGQAVSLSPLMNDDALGALPENLFLCSVSPAETAPHCYSTEVIVAGEGTWSVDLVTGAVSFMPLADFTEESTRINYVAQDAIGQPFASSMWVTISSSGTPVNNPALTPTSPPDSIASAPAMSVQAPTSAATPKASKPLKRRSLPITGAVGLNLYLLVGLFCIGSGFALQSWRRRSENS